MVQKARYRVSQFFRALTARVSCEEVEQAIHILTPGARALFRRQAVQDQRHALAVYMALQQGGHTDPHLLAAALLHDVGKIGVEDSILRKAGKLSEAEYEHIKQHAEIGHRILHDLSKLEGVLPVVLHHHESWDGRGYPQRLGAERIPLAARIVAVADAFDAMSSDRPYRKGLPDEKIDEIFHAGAGKQWDPAVVDAFFSARDDIREIVRREREEIRIEMGQWA